MAKQMQNKAADKDVFPAEEPPTSIGHGQSAERVAPQFLHRNQEMDIELEQ